MEIWDAHNDKREKISQYLVRGERIPSGLYHLCVNVLVRHEDGDVLFMRRSSQKNSIPTTLNLEQEEVSWLVKTASMQLFES